MTFKEIQELIALINKSNLTEFKMKDGEFELAIRTSKYTKGRPQQVAFAPVAPPVQAAPPPSAATPKADASKPAAEAASEEGNYLQIKSPIVGTFYRSSGPDKAAFVKVGDVVDTGSVVCIVEAMKLFNEIESEVKGRIVKVLVEDASPVEYDQPLFLVDPKG